MDSIDVRGAREHNLKNIDVAIPRNQLVVVTGPSGSGKSSLAMDTIFAEGQRRYVESLSAHARQFLAQLPKPSVDSVEGMSPAIAIDQRNAARSPRSTVATATEIHDYLRLLWSHAGQAHCPQCQAPVSAHSVEDIVRHIMAWPEGQRVALLAPVAKGTKKELTKEIKQLQRKGFVRIRLDGEVHDIEEELPLNDRRTAELEVFVDRLACRPQVRARLADSLETALAVGHGLVRLVRPEGPEELLSDQFACLNCEVTLPRLEPRLFSFNNPEGACPKCGGLGHEMTFTGDGVVPDGTLSLRQGAVEPWSRRGGSKARLAQLLETAGACNISPDDPWQELPKKSQQLILHGTAAAQGRNQRPKGEPEFEGVIPWLQRRYEEFQRRKRNAGTSEDELFDKVADEFHRYMTQQQCSECGGARLRREALAVTVGGVSVAQLSALTIEEAADYFAALEVPKALRPIVDQVVEAVRRRLDFLRQVGLGYLTLDRRSSSLAGGEAQRIRLATQLGAALVGVLYVLDEPSIGLHQRDNQRLLATLRRLRDLGNTVLVVEHDGETIDAADWVIDMGPGAGRQGGEVTAAGPPQALAQNPASLTGGYLSGRLAIPLPRRRAPRAKRMLTLRSARLHNLQSLDVTWPLERLVCVTGVSGSGKSSLVVGTLLPELERRLQGGRPAAGTCDGLDGTEQLDKIVAVDQAPIGRSPRSNPATFTGLMTGLRELFAGIRDARARGFGAARFSFNVKGGRCEACQGDGTRRVAMHFLPDLYVRCDQCGGRRYNEETLDIKFKGKNIADVLEMTIDEAALFLENVPPVKHKLATLQSVGLGYLQLGQSATTLSGGEAQRLKLARELARRTTGRTLYVFDEPTTGLHHDDVRRLLDVLQRLVEAGNSLIVVEHNLEVIKCADWVIDLGPEGGPEGGQLVVAGTPEEVAQCPASHTGRYLRALLPHVEE
jgi:excinuclease ABC subunit A